MSLPRFRSTSLMGLILVGVLVASSPAMAAAVTTNEAGLDAIFSQASFGVSPIDIRFDSIVTVSNSSLLDIDSATDFSLLFTIPILDNHVNMFFVDTISWCGETNPAIVGWCCRTGDGRRISVCGWFIRGGTECARTRAQPGARSHRRRYGTDGAHPEWSNRL